MAASPLPSCSSPCPPSPDPKGILESSAVRLLLDDGQSSGDESALRKLLRRPSFTLPKLSSGQSQLIWLDLHVLDFGRSMYWSNSRFGFFGPSRLKTALDLLLDTSHLRRPSKTFTFQNSAKNLMHSSFSTSSSSSSSNSSSNSNSTSTSMKRQPDAYFALIAAGPRPHLLLAPQLLRPDDAAQREQVSSLVLSQPFVPSADLFAAIQEALGAVELLRESFAPNHVIIQSVIHVYTDQKVSPEVPGPHHAALKDLGLGASLSLFLYAFAGLSFFDLKEFLEHCKGELLCVDYSKTHAKIVRERNQLIFELQRPFQAGASHSAETHTLPNIHFLEEEAWHEELNVVLTKLDPLFRFEKVLRTHGIFRVPGRADDVNELCHQITNIKDPLRIEVLLEDPQVIYTLADTFKRSLRHSKLELLPQGSLPAMLRAVEQQDPVLRKVAVAKILSGLTRTLQEVLFRFFRILNRVASYAEFNMMDAENLCILFTPLLTSSKVRLSLKNFILCLINDPCYFFPDAATLIQATEQIALST